MAFDENEGRFELFARNEINFVIYRFEFQRIKTWALNASKQRNADCAERIFSQKHPRWSFIRSAEKTITAG